MTEPTNIHVQNGRRVEMSAVIENLVIGGKELGLEHSDRYEVTGHITYPERLSTATWFFTPKEILAFIRKHKPWFVHINGRKYNRPETEGDNHVD